MRPFAFMALYGVSNGFSLSVFGSLWPEIYGVKHKWYGGQYDSGHLNRINTARSQIEKNARMVEELCKDECP